MTRLHFEILVPQASGDRVAANRAAHSIFEIWSRVAPQWLPDRGGIAEPLRGKFELSDLDKLTDRWLLDLMFQRVARPSVESGIHRPFGPIQKHLDWRISIDLDSEDQAVLLTRLLVTAADYFCVDFGYVHCIHPSDATRGGASRSVYFLDKNQTKNSMHVASLYLQKFIPDIYWFTIFGPPYVKFLSRERLMFRLRHLLPLAPPSGANVGATRNTSNILLLV